MTSEERKQAFDNWLGTLTLEHANIEFDEEVLEKRKPGRPRKNPEQVQAKIRTRSPCATAGCPFQVNSSSQSTLCCRCKAKTYAGLLKHNESSKRHIARKREFMRGVEELNAILDGMYPSESIPTVAKRQRGRPRKNQAV